MALAETHKKKEVHLCIPDCSANVSPSAPAEMDEYECLTHTYLFIYLIFFFPPANFDLTMPHTYTHLGSESHFYLRFTHDCLYVRVLHNAGAKVSGLIFYLSGVITVAFTAALLFGLWRIPLSS